MKHAMEENGRAVLRVLPVQVRASATGPTELSGTPVALHRLAATLASDESSEAWALEIPDPPDPSPYERFLKAIRVIRAPGRIQIERQGDLLALVGSPESLQILADNIKWLAESVGSGASSDAADHLHIEYHPDHFYLRSSSEPLVITVLGKES